MGTRVKPLWFIPSRNPLRYKGRCSTKARFRKSHQTCPTCSCPNSHRFSSISNPSPNRCNSRGTPSKRMVNLPRSHSRDSCGPTVADQYSLTASRWPCSTHSKRRRARPHLPKPRDQYTSSFSLSNLLRKTSTDTTMWRILLLKICRNTSRIDRSSRLLKPRFPVNTRTIVNSRLQRSLALSSASYQPPSSRSQLKDQASQALGPPISSAPHC